MGFWDFSLKILYSIIKGANQTFANFGGKVNLSFEFQLLVYPEQLENLLRGCNFKLNLCRRVVICYWLAFFSCFYSWSEMLKNFSDEVNAKP